MATDAESSTVADDAAEERRKSLFALKVLFERGLLPKAEYEARLARLDGSGG